MHKFAVALPEVAFSIKFSHVTAINLRGILFMFCFVVLGSHCVAQLGLQDTAEVGQDQLHQCLWGIHRSSQD